MSEEASNLFAFLPELTCDFQSIPTKELQKKRFIESRFLKDFCALKTEDYNYQST